MSRARLALRDLAAACALASMAVSGEVPPWALAIFAAGAVLALLSVRPFSGRGGFSAVLLALGAVALFSSVGLGRLDLVVAACTFAGLVTVQRMLSEPSVTTEAQVLLTSLLLVAGAAALSGQLLYAPCLIAFSALATVTRGLSTVEGGSTSGDPEPRSAAPLLARGALVAVLGGVALFFVLPRLTWNVMGRRSASLLGRATVGMSDRVRLGGNGRIKTNPRVVLRASLTPDPGAQELRAYWVGQTFDTFDGREWSAAPSAPARAQDEVMLPSRTGGRAVFQRMELLPSYGSRTLVALDAPLKLGGAVAHLPGGEVRTRLALAAGRQVRFELDAPAYAYVADSRWGGASAGAPEEAELKRALELPKLDPRVASLAAAVTKGEKDPMAAAERLERYLQARYRYTLDLTPQLADPLADFLFGAQAGRCEHFATALAVLLRTRGIPAWVVTGFYGGQRAAGGYLVRAGDAHAWTEAYIEGKGLVRLDATPEESRSAMANPLLDWLLERYEALEVIWQRTVVDYSFRDQASFAERLLSGPAGGHLHRAPWPGPGWLWLVPLAGVAWAAARWWRGRWAHAGEATQLLAELEEVLTRSAGIALPDGGLEALARGLSASAHPLAAPVGRATRRYLEARFGGRPLEMGERRRLTRGLRAAVESGRKRPHIAAWP